ncbi:MAG: class I SAM-dependent RNA methyltransferase [Bryobacterales bacterium]|nr:class I SAM-dependent RNA methyltransferase [Bryobacterales bacterium]
MELLIEKLIYGGDSLARDNGKVIFTPFVLPGERVIASAVSSRKDLTRAHATEIVEKSPHRTQPPCPYFSTCGGCAYQHAAYAYQVEQKVEILKDVLRRVGRFTPPDSIAAITGPEWEYRNRVQLHFDGRKMGYHRAGSHDIVSVDQCPISSPAINRAIKSLQTMTRSRRWPSFLRTFELFSNEEKTLFNVLDAGSQRLSRNFFEWMNGEIPGALDSSLVYDGFRVSHRSFFQVNRFLINQLVEAATAGAEGETCLDLYSGVGLFSRALAAKFSKVTAVEAVQSAAHDLEQNVPAVTSIRQSVEDYLLTVDSPPDYVIADPPRAGLTDKVTRELLRIKPKRVTLVSCDPATLARDLAALQPAYGIGSITLIDLFPQTAAIETITHLALAI